MAENKVTKIYDLKTLGYDDIMTQLNSINSAFDNIRKSKVNLNNQRSSVFDANEIAELNKRLQEQDARMASLVRQVNALTEARRKLNNEEKAGTPGPTNSVSEYSKLIAKYKEAQAAAREMAVQFGAESQQALTAARAAAQYRQELIVVNNVVKNGTAQTALLTQEQAKNTERTKQLNQETRQLAKDALAAGNSIEKLRAQLSLATSRRNRLQIDSAEFKEAEADVLRLSTQLKQLEAQGGDFRRNVGNYASGFDGVRNSINQLTREAPAFANSVQTGFLALSNNIPIFFDEVTRARNEITRLRAAGEQVPGLFQQIAGSIFSFGTILSVGVTLLTIYGKEIGEFVKSIFKGKDAVDQFTMRQKLLATELKSGGGYTEAIKNVKDLQINIDLAKRGLISKKEVVDQYNSSIGKVAGEVKSLDEAEKALVKNGDAYIRMMLLKAAANQALEEAAKKAVEAEKIRNQDATDFLTTGDQIISATAASAAATPGGGFIPNLAQNTQQQAQAFNDQQSAIRKKTAEDAAEKDVDTLEGIAKKFQEDAARIASENGFVSFLGNGTNNTQGASKLDTATQEELKKIDAARNQLLAAEKTRQNEIARVRKLSFDDEVAYLRNVERINADALIASIAILERKKTLNAEEKQTLAQFREELSSIYLETSNRINEIERRRFEQEERLINQRLQLKVKEAERERQLVDNNPTLSAQARAEQQLAIDQELFDAQLQALQELEQQSTEFNEQAIARQREAVERAGQVVAQTRREVSLAEVQDIETAGENQVLAIQTSYAISRKAILDNEKLTREQKDRQIQLLDQAETRTILSAELEALNREVTAKKLLLDQGLISEQEYLAAITAQRQKAAELSGVSGGNQVNPARGFRTPLELLQGGRTGGGGLRGLFGIDRETDPDEDQLLGQAIATSFNVAQEAMNGYFDAEESRIRDNLRIQQERLKIEEEQALFRAQSQAEQDAIRRDFDTRKRAEEKKAGEELKRIKIAEARIALATELANIAAAAASNPANGATFGASGAIMYGILSAAALARYALNTANINRQVFEYGGNLQSDAVPVRGGEIGGNPHGQGGAPFTFNGEQKEAEVKELAIIRTKNAPQNKTFTITGTQRQIASMLNQIGGGVAFAPGGRVRQFAMGGVLGESLQPPTGFSPVNNIFASQQISRSDVDQMLSKYTDRVERLAQEQSSRVDRIEVLQVTNTVTDAQRKLVQQQRIGTL
jgi:hypothetical protein